MENLFPQYRFLLQTFYGEKANLDPRKFLLNMKEERSMLLELICPIQSIWVAVFTFLMQFFQNLANWDYSMLICQNNRLQYAVRMIGHCVFAPDPSSLKNRWFLFTLALQPSYWFRFTLRRNFNVFCRTWVCTFSTSIWNVFDVNDKMSTTNAFERWNNSWKRENNRTRPYFWVSMRFLKLHKLESRNKVANLHCRRAPALQKKEMAKK